MTTVLYSQAYSSREEESVKEGAGEIGRAVQALNGEKTFVHPVIH